MATGRSMISHRKYSSRIHKPTPGLCFAPQRLSNPVEQVFKNKFPGSPRLNGDDPGSRFLCPGGGGGSAQLNRQNRSPRIHQFFFVCGFRWDLADIFPPVSGGSSGNMAQEILFRVGLHLPLLRELAARIGPCIAWGFIANHRTLLRVNISARAL